MQQGDKETAWGGSGGLVRMAEYISDLDSPFAARFLGAVCKCPYFSI